jgi:hypothetical protein
MKRSILFIGALLGCLSFFPPNAAGQNRDYFTDDEVEMIRNAQEIDARIDVLTHCIDRRFAVLKIGSVKINPEKEKDKWGPMPAGTHTELLADVKNILQKAVDDIDNLAERPDSAPIPLDPKEKRKDSSVLFSKAVRNLAAAAKQYEPALKAELDASKDQRERGILLDSIELCDEIIASVGKLKS